MTKHELRTMLFINAAEMITMLSQLDDESLISNARANRDGRAIGLTQLVVFLRVAISSQEHAVHRLPKQSVKLTGSICFLSGFDDCAAFNAAGIARELRRRKASPEMLLPREWPKSQRQGRQSSPAPKHSSRLGVHQTSADVSRQGYLSFSE
jgi:hypothetical protein